MTLSAWLKKIPFSHSQVSELHFHALRHFAIRSGWTNLHAPVITVTGTNGKGSTVAVLEAILLASGFRVGIFTSPHLLNFTERVKINGVPVNEDHLYEVLQRIDAQKGNLSLTQFQYVTLAAFQLFQEVPLDVIIMEVGVGGRLDPVNILDADIAVLTSLALDHTAWLGENREAIGREKAGIFRFSKPVICGDPHPSQSVVDKAHELKCPFYYMNHDFGWTEDDDTWTWWNKNKRYENLPQPSLQLQNAATALQVVDLFSSHAMAIPEGLRNVYLPGRLQRCEGIIEHIVDVAHNPAAAHLLAASLIQKPCAGTTHVVVGMLEDKDRKGTLSALLGKATHWYLADLEGPRGGTSQALSEILIELNERNFHTFSSVTHAYQNALANAVPNDRIVIFGSFHTVAKVIHLFL